MYGENLKRLRFELKMSAQQMADDLGIHKMSISNYETEKRKPTFEFMEQLLDKYNVNLNWFMAGIGNMFIEQDNFNLSDTEEEKIKAYVRKILADKGII